jgi:hypothetical protein
MYLLLASGPYAGSDACARCHPREYEKQVRSHHALALRRIADTPLPAVLTGAPYRRSGDAIEVSFGAQVSGTLEWAFGAGAQGITPVGRSNGRYFEYRYSYYRRLQGLALTFGHPAHAATPGAELGILQSDRTIARCFSCHSTGDEQGVRCERCHGPGAAHVALAASGGAADPVRRAVVNPGRFAARAQVEICGECHRLPAPGGGSPEPELEEPVSVRFAPVGLMASRCFGSRKLACTTCHDPHEDARPRTDYAYNSRCSECHGPNVKTSHCPRQTRSDCLECHMRQTFLGPYLRFTDHRIRVYR